MALQTHLQNLMQREECCGRALYS